MQEGRFSSMAPLHSFAAFLLGVNSTKGQGFLSRIGQWSIVWLCPRTEAPSVFPTWCLGLVSVHSDFPSSLSKAI